MNSEPSAGKEGWEELAAQLRAAVQDLESSVAGAPLAEAGRVQKRLAEIAACLTEAEQLWRTGRREGVELFRRELEHWRERQPEIRAWIEATASLAGGWSLAAGAGLGYGTQGRGLAGKAPGKTDNGEG